jgi:hypothetical protein
MRSQGGARGGRRCQSVAISGNKQGERESEAIHGIASRPTEPSNQDQLLPRKGIWSAISVNARREDHGTC